MPLKKNPFLRPWLSLLRLLPGWLLIGAMLAGFGASMSGLLLMGTAAYLIAAAALQPPLYALAVPITLVRACGLGRAAFRYLERWLSHRAAFCALGELRRRLCSLAEASLPLKGGAIRQGEYLQLLTAGCDTLRDACLRVLLPPLPPLLLCLLAALLLWPYLGGIALSLPLLWLLHLLLPLCLEREEALAAAYAAYRRRLLDVRHGMTELCCAGSASLAAALLDRDAEALGRRIRQAERRRHRTDALLLLLQGCLLALWIALLIPSAVNGRLDGIWFCVFLLVLMGLLAELAALPAAMRAERAALPAARMLLDETKLPASKSSANAAPPARNPVAPLLAVEDLCFSYHAGIPVLRHLSFQLKKGSRIACSGESGCGKTTLAYLLLRLWEADAGTMLLDGTPRTPDGQRRFFAPAVQGGYIFSCSLRQNFRQLHPAIEDDAIWDALAAARLAETVRALPQGLDTPLGEDGCRLSGGQRQRLLVALALASPAPILLLDEPTAGLDEKTAHALMESLLSPANARTLLLITHDRPLADRLDARLAL